jgi:hypothetical protein
MEGRPGNGRQELERLDTSNKQERTTMQGNSAEGLPADPREALAANEDFVGEEFVLEQLTQATRSGWNPYDVWRTRVKSSSARNEHEADPRR